MIVTSKTNAERWALFLFLKEHGVLQTRTDDFHAIGRVASNGKLVGVVGYNGFIGNTCCVHVAGIGNWVNRELLWAAFDYPFMQAKMEHLIGTVAESNTKAIHLNRHLGFEVLHRLRDGWKIGVDLIIMRMARYQCRWLKLREQVNELKVA